MTYDVVRGISRNWYAGEDGVRRWVDDNKPVDIETPIDPRFTQAEQSQIALARVAIERNRREANRRDAMRRKTSEET